MSVIIPERYRQLRAAAPVDNVSMGYASIHLTLVAELETAQQGYSVIPEDDETDWQDDWVVIGYEGLCGDPIFIDTSNEDFPVYTAAHGMGQWSPQLIASSFSHFIQILERLQALAHGRANPVEMERHPITDEESEALAKFISGGSPNADLAFWQGICETDT